MLLKQFSFYSPSPFLSCGLQVSESIFVHVGYVYYLLIQDFIYIFSMRGHTNLSVYIKTSLAFCFRLCILLVPVDPASPQTEILEAAPLHMHLNASMLIINEFGVLWHSEVP